MSISGKGRVTKTRNRNFSLGLVFWIFCIQYYVTQVVASWAWKTPYSWSQNTISDLGNTVCGQYGQRYICSPLHPLMNVSFIVLGISMITGVLLIYPGLSKSRTALAAFGTMAIAGLGTVLVGLFPENTVSALHITGAALPFVVGNVSLLLFGCTAGVSAWLRAWAVLFGVISLCALGLFLSHHYLGLGEGGMERITAYPQTIWLIGFGVSRLFCRRSRDY